MSAPARICAVGRTNRPGPAAGTTRRPFISRDERAGNDSLAELAAPDPQAVSRSAWWCEHGGNEGLVTVADLTGEIVGDVKDNSQFQAWRDLSQIDAEQLAWWLGISRSVELNVTGLAPARKPKGTTPWLAFLLERLQHIPSRGGEQLRWKGDHFENQAPWMVPGSTVLITRRAAERRPKEPILSLRHDLLQVEGMVALTRSAGDAMNPHRSRSNRSRLGVMRHGNMGWHRPRPEPVADGRTGRCCPTSRASRATRRSAVRLAAGFSTSKPFAPCRGGVHR